MIDGTDGRQAGPAALALEVIENLPSLTAAVPFTERIRSAAMGVARRRMGYGEIPQELSGRDDAGYHDRTPGHEHAFFFCEPGLDAPSIRFVNVYCPVGFSPEAMVALSGVRFVWMRAGRRVALRTSSQDPLVRSPIFAESTTWESLTPFVLSRHLHIRRSSRRDRRLWERDFKEAFSAEVEHELSLFGFPAPVQVILNKDHVCRVGRHWIQCRKFVRERKDGRLVPPVRFGHSVRILFERPVKGPLSLGFGNHFGLGLFVPQGAGGCTESRRGA